MSVTIQLVIVCIYSYTGVATAEPSQVNICNTVKFDRLLRKIATYNKKSRCTYIAVGLHAPYNLCMHIHACNDNFTNTYFYQPL